MSSKIIFKKEGVFLKSEKETEFIKFKKIRKICKRHGFYVIVHNSTSTSIDYHQYDDKMNRIVDNVEYTCLKQFLNTLSVTVSELILGDIIKIPDEYFDKGINGKIIEIEKKFGRGHSKFYKFTILLADKTSFEITKKEDFQIIKIF